MTVNDDTGGAPDLDDDAELDAAAEAAADEMAQEDENDAQGEPGDSGDDPEGDDSGDDPDEDQEDDQGARKPGVRQRLKAAEERVAELEEALSASRWAMFHKVVGDMGLSGELMIAAGLKVEDHIDGNGDVDVEALAAAADSKRGQLGLPRRPKPNPVVSRGRAEPRQEEPTTFGGILKQHVESSGTYR